MRKYIFSLVLGVGMMMANVGYTLETTLPDGTTAPIPDYNNTSSTSASPASATSTNKGPVEVIVTEEVPGAICTCSDQVNQCKKPETRKYICKVDKGLGAFQAMFAQIVRWIVNIVMLLGVLAIVGAGILWSWGSDSEEQTKKAKGWVINIMIGLFILFTFRYILGFLAPWIFV